MAIPTFQGTPSQEIWNEFGQGSREELCALMQRYINGELTDALWAEETTVLLETLHAEAAYLGRTLAGDTALFGELDLAYGKVIGGLENEFLQQFQADLWGGVYLRDDGTLMTDLLLNRIDTYGGRLRGTSSETFVAYSGDHLIYWILGGENNCEECPDIASMSPYTQDTLPCMPGTNETPCLFNCNCYLLRDDGVSSFQPDDTEDAQVAVLPDED